jgi:hypothetical protein
MFSLPFQWKVLAGESAQHESAEPSSKIATFAGPIPNAARYRRCWFSLYQPKNFLTGSQSCRSGLHFAMFTHH